MIVLIMLLDLIHDIYRAGNLSFDTTMEHGHGDTVIQIKSCFREVGFFWSV